MNFMKHLTAAFTTLVFLLLLAGCNQSDAPSNDDIPSKSDNAGSESQPPVTGSSEGDSESTGEGSVVAKELFPEIPMRDADGLSVTRRDLHGFLSAMVLFPDQQSITNATAELQQLAEVIEVSPYENYSQVIALVTDPQAEIAMTLAESSPFQIWQCQSKLPKSLKDGQVLLVEPATRISLRLSEWNAEAASELGKAVRDVWRQQVPFLAEVLNSTWMNARQERQLQEAANLPVLHDFSFNDIRRASGIEFLHQIVDDAGIDYKGVHYDHGSGLTIADVDSDGLIDIYFVNQLGASALYRNLGEGRFEDITQSAGVAIGDRITVAASFADIDNDSDPDLYVTSVREGNLLFLNDGNGRFREVGEQYGVDYRGHSSASVFFDYDRDGFLDLFLCNVGEYTTDERGRGGYYVGHKDAFSGHLKPERSETSRLYHNLNGQGFEDVTEAVGLEDDSWTGDAAFLDVNRDGWLDLYLLDMQGNDEYYENQQGRSFIKRSREIFPRTPWGAMGVAVRDFDADLDLDLLVTDMHSDMSKDILADVRSEASMASFYEEEKQKATMQLPESLLKSEGASLFGNAFFRQDDDGTFAEVSGQANAENYWPWGLSSGDLNADGFDDVFITSSMNYPFRYGVNSLLLNDGKRFHDAEFITSVEPRADGRTAQPWMSLDTQQAEGKLLEKVVDGREGKITVWGALGSRASAIFDFDNDGDLDIVTGEFNDRPMMLQSNLAQNHKINFVKIKLEGNANAAKGDETTGAKVSNRDAIGALLTIRSGNQERLKFNDGKTGYLAQGLPEIYCGLGDSTTVDSITVKWPDGEEATYEGPWESGSQIQLKQAAP